jgi:hypothetical protein
VGQTPENAVQMVAAAVMVYFLYLMSSIDEVVGIAFEAHLAPFVVVFETVKAGGEMSVLTANEEENQHS